MFNNVKLGIAPIGWTNDDMPQLGGELTFEQMVSEAALAGFQGTEVGGKFPTDPAELNKALDLRGIKIASQWFSSFLCSTPYEENEKAFIEQLDFLEAVGAPYCSTRSTRASSTSSRQAASQSHSTT